jgi:PadR family transcriptional regulator, regulatory protein PadR
MPQEFVQGTLEMLVLTVTLEPVHGYGIALRLEQVSPAVFRINPGSLRPVLSRLERAGRFKAEWRARENNHRARSCQHTSRGRKTFEEERAQWDLQIVAINRIPRSLTEGALHVL